MTRLLRSGIFVGAGFLASILSVVVIARSVTPETLNGFFLYQAVYFPVLTLLSQSNIVMMFRSGGHRRRNLWLEAGSLVLAVGALSLLGRGYFTPADILFYTAALPLAYLGTTQMAQIQFHGARSWVVLVPLVTALARVGACWGGLALGFGPAISFAAGALMWWGVPVAARTFVVPQVVSQTNQPAASSLGATAAVPAQAEWLPVLVFFGVNSVTFQWDRVLFSQIPLPDLIAITGACMTWALSPVSTLFATIYRSEARQIFTAPPQALDRRAYGRRAGLFLGAVLAYAVVLSLIWTPLNALAFPFLEAPVHWVWMLIGAVALDRCGHLVVFMRNDIRLYSYALVIKACTIGLAVSGYVGLGRMSGLTPGITEAYAIYLGASLAYLAALVLWPSAKKPAATL